MIQHYQNILNECIDVRENKVILTKMNLTLNIMKCNMEILKQKKLKSRIQKTNINIQKKNWINFVKGV